jgi:hypothetical protein
MYAQEGLQIASLFQKYADRKGSTYVNLSKIASDNWEISRYQSLQLAKAAPALPDIYRALDADREQAKKIKEVVHDGAIQSAYYQLPPLKKEINRFILFRLGKKGKATLIYIEGKITSDDLVTLLFNKE